jgi:putative tryptophan/tyrosine transport system substrate-binding protein
VTRREFITLLGGAAVAWPSMASAQQPGEQLRRISILSVFSDSDQEARSLIAVFRQKLTELGWSEGRNIRTDYCWTSGDANRMRACATELATTPPDAVLAIGTQSVAALHQRVQSAPIVFVQISSPVEGGFVASMARPGGNMTGFTNFEGTIGGKWVGLLKEVAPRLARVLVLFNPDNPGSRELLRHVEAMAPSLGVGATSAHVRDPAAIEPAITAFAQQPNGGLVVLPDSVTVVHRDLIISLAARHGLPAIYPHRLFVTSGGLISYGTDLFELYQRAAGYVDRVLRGEKPAHLPVQAPVKFVLMVNNKSAAMLGLKIPESFLLRADEVID